jgi:hypothetical protein
MAEGPAINDSTPVPDQDDRSRRFPGPDGLFNDFGNRNKAFFPDFSRAGWKILDRGGRGGTRLPKKGEYEKKE